MGRNLVWRYKVLQRRPDDSIRVQWKKQSELGADIDEDLLKQLRDVATSMPTHAVDMSAVHSLFDTAAPPQLDVQALNCRGIPLDPDERPSIRR